jgi:hypothetical protein
MVCEEEVQKAVDCDCSPAKATPTLQPPVVRCLPSISAANEQEPPWFEPDPLGWDAPISLWWDDLPAGET